MRWIVLLCVSLLGGCASNGARIDQAAKTAGLTRHDVLGAKLRGYIYMRRDVVGKTLKVFLEGDGQPWLHGVQINPDPATRRPIALELLERTSGPVAYLVRPCYLDASATGCSPDHWTHARYSEQVVASMAAAIAEGVRLAQSQEVELIGYSGGGVLAVLIAERLGNVARVVTVAANLDVDAWTQHHGYLRLERSLDPARSTRPHSWPELHLQGARDVNVPPAITDAYFDRHSNAQRRVLAEFDHVCCWVEAWPRIVEERSSHKEHIKERE